MYNKLNQMKYVIFGSGHYGKAAAMTLGKESVRCFVDNDKTKWGTKVLDIDIVSPEYLKNMTQEDKCIISMAQPSAMEVALQLDNLNIAYTFFDIEKYELRPRLVSYSQMHNMEDVMLYEVLRDEDDIFYIDVGCNDPFQDSVTKLLYDVKQAHGLNIDVLEEMISAMREERPRDLSICLGVGEREDEKTFYVQGGLSSFLPNYAQLDSQKRSIKVMTLSQICSKYLSSNDPLKIQLLKIDVEGWEGAVIRGADWSAFRPWIVLVESTEPCTMIPSWEEWETELISKGYHFILMAGVNRYYVANEHKELDERFLTPDELLLKYRIFHADLKRVFAVPKME